MSCEDLCFCPVKFEVIVSRDFRDDVKLKDDVVGVVTLHGCIIGI